MGIWLLWLHMMVPSAAWAADRVINIEVNTVISGIPAGAGPIDVYLPLAQDTARQTVRTTDLRSNIDGMERREPVYDNRYWHGHLDAATGEDVTVTLSHVVVRRDQGRAKVTDAERSQFIKANQRVPIAGPLIEQAISGLGSHDGTPKGKARAIYDYVIDNVDYKKTGTGWGNGDTEWACTKKYGNCTDFHALFTSMARAQGLPSRFEIGYPVPMESTEGAIGGYHCWIEVALPNEGWFPIDASEAKKHPERKEALFGSQASDRIRFTVGRDLVLEGQKSPPLNYFINPHVEVDGTPWSQVESTVRYSTSE